MAGWLLSRTKGTASIYIFLSADLCHVVSYMLHAFAFAPTSLSPSPPCPLHPLLFAAQRPSRIHPCLHPTLSCLLFTRVTLRFASLLSRSLRNLLCKLPKSLGLGRAFFLAPVFAVPYCYITQMLVHTRTVPIGMIVSSHGNAYLFDNEFRSSFTRTIQ